MANTAKKKIKWLRYVILAFLCLTLYSVLTGPSGILNVNALNRQQKQQQQAMDSLQFRKEELVAESTRLKNDTSYIEIIARKELGMIKHNEKVFRYLPAKSKIDSTK